MRPSLGRSKPASMRSRVDLPQPEPPSRAKISPLWMLSETSSTAIISSNFLVTRSILTRISLACASVTAFFWAVGGVAI
ncbi:hypothetical protein D3C85_1359230 [compost metagenome]